MSSSPYSGTPSPEGDRDPSTPPPAPRPIIERLGLALIALVMAGLFGTVGAASFAGGEPFLGVMGVIGCLMVLWVGAQTLFRGR